MVEKIEVVIKENGTVVDKISQNTNNTFGELLNAIQVVGQATNNLLTKMIEAHGDSERTMENDDDIDEESDSDEENEAQNTPKKRKT